MMHGFYNWWYPGLGLIGVIFSMVFLGLGIYLIIQIINKIKTNSMNSIRKNSSIDPVSIAKIRYAEGEINQKEYNRILKNIKINT